MSETRVQDSIDEQARSIASDACRGVIDEHTARMRIMELIAGAKIAQFVADRTSAHSWEREEVEERVHENLIDRVLDGDGLDLEVAAHSSVIGWARQEAFRKAKWSLGEIRREQSKLQHVGDLLEIDSVSETAPDPSDEFMDLADGFTEKAKGTRERGRSIIAARTLLDAYRLPNPIPPHSRSDCDWIEDAISKDHGIAHRALSAFVHLIEGQMTEAERCIDQRLLAMWDDYSYEQAEMLSGKAPLVVRTIVAAAVSRRPRPSKKVISEVVDIALLAGTGKEWDDYAQKTVETWLARECEPFSEFSAPGAAERRKARQEAAERASEWDSLIAQSEKYGFPFGDDPEEAATWIASAFDSIIAYPSTL